jgi:uncharacterized Zn finger protein
MSEPTERVAAACPACSPEGPTTHELLKMGGRATVRCSDCGHVHKTELERERTVERRVIVSQDGDSFEAYGEMPPDERVVTGEEFLLETDEAIFTVRVTDLELVDGGRSKAADAEEIRTVWSRAVGNVSVNLTLHSGRDRTDGSRSVKIRVPGDEAFVVGETHEYGDESFTVESVIVREAALGDYRFEHLKHDGDRVLAKDVKRLYARDEIATAAWSAW